jgi:streptogramin lyase
LNQPTGLAVDAAGSLYISDWQNSRAVKVYGMSLSSSSSGVGVVLPSGSITYGSNSITGVAVDAFGNLYAADRSNNRVVKVTPSGTASPLDLTGMTPDLNNPQGVAVDGMGNVYIADSGNNRIVQVTTRCTNRTQLRHPYWNCELHRHGWLYRHLAEQRNTGCSHRRNRHLE